MPTGSTWSFTAQRCTNYTGSRREVRVFPLLEQSGRPVPALLSQLLATLGIPHRIQRVGYEFQRGGNEMLVLNATQ